MEMIKKMIADYDDLVEEAKKRADYHASNVTAANRKVKTLKDALELISGNEEAEKLIKAQMIKEAEWVENHGKRFMNDTKKEYETILNAKKYFLDVMFMNCTHEWVYLSTDFHKNEDFHKCSICGKVA